MDRANELPITQVLDEKDRILSQFALEQKVERVQALQVQ